MILSDEARFTRDGVNNYYNRHIWSLVNPQAFRETHFQKRLGANVWACIFNGSLPDLQVIDGRLNGAACLTLLQNRGFWHFAAG